MNTIKLGENCGIKTIGDFHRAAVRCMEEGRDCTLDFSDVRRVDLSVAQVAIALRLDCVRRGGRCEMVHANESTLQLLRYAGI